MFWSHLVPAPANFTAYRDYTSGSPGRSEAAISWYHQSDQEYLGTSWNTRGNLWAKGQDHLGSIETMTEVIETYAQGAHIHGIGSLRDPISPDLTPTI